MSLKIHHTEIASLRAQIVQGDTTDDVKTRYNCSYYKSGLHGGGRILYPWKDKALAEAKAEAITFMLRMLEGAVVPP